MENVPDQVSPSNITLIRCLFPDPGFPTTMMKYPSPAEIAEMKARGYDSATITEAEEASKRWTRAQEIGEIIRKAFEGVTLGNGIGLQEAQGIDDYEDAATCARYRAGDEKIDWQRIPVDALNRCDSSLSFFNAEGMRFHLPAYLIADLHGDYSFGMAFCLTHLSKHCLKQFSLLSDDQRNAVREFLRFALDEEDYQFVRADILRALDEYWSTVR